MKVEGNAILINTGDIIRMDIGDRIRVWRVTGIYLGSVREEDCIGIECLDMYHGAAPKEMMVPRHIIELVVCNEHRITMPLDVQIRVSGCPNILPKIKVARWEAMSAKDEKAGEVAK